MKKFVSLLLVGIISVTSFASGVSAQNVSNKDNFSSVPLIYQDNINAYNYETRGVKSWVTKAVIRSAAGIIRTGGDVAYWAIKKVGFDGRKIKKIINRKDEIADALERFANDINRAEVELTTTLKVYLISQGFDEDIANMVSLFINFIL